jgi:class 3 adenylate cyclase
MHSNPLDRYLPPELRAKLETAHHSGLGAGERRIVTMLFCDVTGSTAAAGRLDPEEWSEVINGAFKHMIEPVYLRGYGGSAHGRRPAGFLWRAHCLRG